VKSVDLLTHYSLLITRLVQEVYYG